MSVQKRSGKAAFNVPQNRKEVEPREIFNLQDAAKFLGVSCPWLKNQITKDDAPANRLCGRRYFFTRRALLDWAENRNKKPQSDS